MAYSPCRDTAGGYPGCNITDQDSPNYDVINHTTSTYLPSCGETGSSSTKADFQKRWSQSFKSAQIPMHKGDKAFIFLRTVGGTLRDNNVAVDGYGTEIYGFGVMATSLPTYWAARNVNQLNM